MAAFPMLVRSRKARRKRVVRGGRRWVSSLWRREVVERGGAGEVEVLGRGVVESSILEGGTMEEAIRLD